MNVRIEPTTPTTLALVGTPQEMAVLHDVLLRSLDCDFKRIVMAARQLCEGLSDPRIAPYLEDNPDA